MSLINKLFGFLLPESAEVKAAKARLAGRRDMTEAEYGRFTEIGASDNTTVYNAAQKALHKPPIDLDKESETIALTDDMAPKLHLPWEAYELWYYWDKGDSDNPWDVKSVGPFNTFELAEEEAKTKRAPPKFFL